MLAATDSLHSVFSLGCLALSSVVAGTLILVRPKQRQPVPLVLPAHPSARKARTAPLEAPPISVLPADVLALCFQFLDGRSALLSSAVCIEWHVCMSHDRAWRNRYGAEYGELPCDWWLSPTLPPELIPCSWRTLFCHRGSCRFTLQQAVQGLDLSARQYTRWAARMPIAALECVLLAVFEFAFNGLHGPSTDGFDVDEHHGFTVRQLAALHVLREAYSIGQANTWGSGAFTITFSAILSGAYTPEGMAPPLVAGPFPALVLQSLRLFIQQRMTPSMLELLLWNIGGWGSRGSPSLAWNGSPTPRPYLERIALKFQAMNDIARGKPTQ